MARPVLAALRVVALGGALVAALGRTVAAAPADGRLVHVADTRDLHGFNLFVANLYNTDRLLFTLFSLALTAALGLVLGVLMDVIVSWVGLDLRRREFKE
jgi:hypothetical protein